MFHRVLVCILVLNSYLFFAQNKLWRALDHIQADNFGLAEQQIRRITDSQYQDLAWMCYYKKRGNWKLSLAHLNSVTLNFSELSKNGSKKLDRFFLDAERMVHLKNELQWRRFMEIQGAPTLSSINVFLEENSTFMKMEEAILLRDELALNEALLTGSSSFLADFMKKYPESTLFSEVSELYCKRFFDEETPNKTIAEFEIFLKNNEETCLADSIKRMLLRGYTEQKNIQKLVQFIEEETNTEHVTSAWNAVFLMEVPMLRKESLIRFKEKFPQYPYKSKLEEQISLAQSELYPFLDNGKYGYMDESGQQRIRCDFEEAGLFYHGLAVVGQEQKYGVIDKEGRMVIPFQYDVIYNFEESSTIVGQGDYYGVIDPFNTLLIPIEFEEIIPLYGNTFGGTKDGKYQIFDATGLNLYTDLFEDIYKSNSFVVVERDHKKNVLDFNGGFLFKEWSDQLSIVNDTLILTKLKDTYALRNEQDSLFFEIDYEQCKILNSDDKCFAFLRKEELLVLDVYGSNLFSYNGEDAPLLFQQMSTTDYFFTSIKKNKYGVVKNKQEKIPFEYDRILLYDSCAVVVQNEEWYICDLQGKRQEQSKSAYIEYLNDNHFCLEQNQQKFVYSSEMKSILGIGHDDVKLVAPSLLLLEKNGLFGLMGLNGETKTPIAFNRIQLLDRGLFVLWTEEGIGYYNALTDTIISQKKN